MSTVVKRKTEGGYVVQMMHKKEWVDCADLPSDFVMRDAERSLANFRKEVPHRLFRLIYRRTEITDELEIGAHEDAR